MFGYLAWASTSVAFHLAISGFDHAPLRHEGLDVDPHHRVVADDLHHPVDAIHPGDVRADGHVGRVGGAERQHPAAVEAGLLQVAAVSWALT